MLKRSFYYLWSSQALSNMADVLYIVALTTLVLEKTGSIVFATLIPFLRVVAQFVSGLAAPLMLVKYRLPFLLGLSQLGQFLLFIVMAVYLSPLAAGEAMLPVYILILLISFLDGWTSPARNALVPRLVHDDALLKANGMIATSDQVIQFGGWAISGILVAAIGSFPVLVSVAIAYGLAMTVTLLIEEPTEPKRQLVWDVRTDHVGPTGNNPASANPVSTQAGNTIDSLACTPSRWDTLKEGWIVLWQSRRLRSMTLMDVTDALGGTVWVGAFLLVFVKEVLLKNEDWWGYINASYFAGTVIGGFLVIALVKRLEKKLFTYMLFGMLGYALCTTLFALNSSAPMALLIVLLTGPFTELSAVTRKTLIQRSCTREQLPKVFSAQGTLLSMVFGFSLIAMSFIAELLGIVNMYLAAAAISVLAAGVGWWNRKAFDGTY